METTRRTRLHLLDEIRGFLIIGVVVSHTLFDMYKIFKMEMEWVDSWPVQLLSDIGAFLFILISGMVTKYSRDNITRGMKLLAVSIAMTLVTRLAMPQMAVYAGILHLLSFLIILIDLIKPVLDKMPRILTMSILFLTGLLTGDIYDRKIGLFNLVFYTIPDNVFNGGLSYLLGFKIKNILISADYYPLLPWSCFFFMGYFLIHYVEKETIKPFFEKKRFRFLSWAGRNSLWIYLAHQPLIIGILYLIYGLN